MNSTIDGMIRNNVLQKDNQAFSLMQDYVYYQNRIFKQQFPTAIFLDAKQCGWNVFSRTGDGKYVDDRSVPSVRFLSEVKDEWISFAPAYYEDFSCFGLFYFSGSRLNFEYRIKANAKYDETSDLSILTFGVYLADIENGVYTPYQRLSSIFSRVVAEETDDDWTLVDLADIGQRNKNAALIVTDYQSLTKSEITPHDWKDSCIEIRGLSTSPPEIRLFNRTIGAMDAKPPSSTITLTKKEVESFAGVFHIVSATMIELSGIAPATGVSKSYIPSAAEIFLKKKNQAYFWNIPHDRLSCAKLIYTLTLAYALSGLPDIEIPMSSFQYIVKQGGATKDEVLRIENERISQTQTVTERLNNGEITEAESVELINGINENCDIAMESLNVSRQSFLSCVVPNATKYIDEIIARGNGDLIIKKGYLMPDGMRNLEEVVRACCDYITTDTGARSSSITVSGHSVRKFASPKIRKVSGVSYIGINQNGKRYIRAIMDMFLRPQDVCVYGNNENERFIVGQIIYTVNENSATMEVSEQDETFNED
jgi:hypothetical protein